MVCPWQQEGLRADNTITPTTAAFYYVHYGPGTGPRVFHVPAEPPGKPKNTGVGSLSRLQGNFPTQESNLGLLHCRQILCHLSHQGSPRILEWVAYPFSGDLPDPGIELGLLHCRWILDQLSYLLLLLSHFSRVRLCATP